MANGKQQWWQVGSSRKVKRRRDIYIFYIHHIFTRGIAFKSFWKMMMMMREMGIAMRHQPLKVKADLS